VKQALRHPLFLAGLGVRLAVLVLVTPFAVDNWYAPFLEVTVSRLSWDPWGTFLAAGGDRLAFPYGYATWLAFAPLAVVSAITGVSATLAYGLTMLGIDIAMLAVLRRQTDSSDGSVLALYWISPVVIFLTYWLGLNDLLPVLLLISGLAFLREHAPKRAAISIALAISAKLSMVLAVPFVLMYLFHNKRLRVFFLPFVTWLGAAVLVLQGLFFASAGGRTMLFGNPELSKVYDLALPLGNGLEVYLLPLTYLLFLFGAWRMRRMSLDLLVSLLGIAFLAVLLLSPALPGWLLWVMPFLVIYQLKSGRIAVALVSVFTLAYIGLSAVQSPLPSVSLAGWPAAAHLSDLWSLSPRLMSLWQTMIIGTGLVLGARMLREGIQANEYFRLSRKPFLLGIAGDSGTGKDTLAEAVGALFGAHSVVRVSGDDYHLWDRHKPMWQVLTHLNPRANDLARFTRDVHSLADGRAVQTAHYDHEHGKVSKPFRLESNDFIIVSGLHALYLPSLRQLYDLRIFLDMNEGLRRSLKVARDVTRRGHNREQVEAALAAREPDTNRFIRPQAAQADLVLSLQPINPEALAQEGAPSRMKLGVRAGPEIDAEALSRVLIGACGLHVDLEYGESDGSVVLTIEGDVLADDIALAARELLPQLNDLLDITPGWRDGMLGLMQLIVLAQITQSLRARLL
jgi:uridine kinase